MKPDRVVIGASDRESADLMKEIYAPLHSLEIPFVVTNVESAELIKYASNGFLATKITFINEIAQVCEKVGADVQDVARGMGLDSRIGPKFLQAGPGFGGSCFPKDTSAMADIARRYGYEFQIMEAVLRVNDDIKQRMVTKIIDAASGNISGKTVAVLGLAFKPETDDMRDSPAIPIIKGLQKRGASIRAYDPQAMENCRSIFENVTYCEDAYETANGADVLVIATEWNEFRALNLERIKKSMSQAILVDLRNVYDPKRVRALGFQLHVRRPRRRSARDRVRHAAQAEPGLTMGRALITGGAGFLGSHLCELFLARGHEVICIDNFITGSPANIKHLIGREGFSFVKYDVTNYIHVDGPLDYVLHFASPASPIDYLEKPIQTLKVGSLGTHKTLGVAKDKKARYLIASTSEVYGDPLVHPQKEDYWGNVNPVGPRGVYDEAKRFAEAMTMAYHRFHGVDTRIVRIFNTYGERMRVNDGRVVPAFISQALRNEPMTVFGDGSQTRSFCYVSDLVEGIYRLLMSNETMPVNIGNPNEMTVLQFAEEIKRLTGSKAPIEFRPLPEDDPKIRRPDISKARALLGWEPKVPLEEGLQRTIDYFRSVVT